MAAITYDKNTKSYSSILNNSPKDLVKVEIGDTKDLTEVQPQVKLMRWDNEYNLSIRLKTEKSKKVSKTTSNVKWNNDKHRISFYEIDGAYEMQIDLDKKPDTNVLEFTLETKGLDFFYQPPLTEEVGIERIVTATDTHGYDKDGNEVCYRPENVVGSYAVYCNDNPRNILGEKVYASGKVAHIYRPRIEDSAGNSVWGELNIDIANSLMMVTIPQDFINNAVYPIKHAAGLTIGITSVGGTTSGGWNSGDSAGSWFGTSPGTDVYAQNINIYTVTGAKNMKSFIMTYVSGYSFLSGSASSAVASTTNGWTTMTYTYPHPHYTDTGSTDYIEPWVVFGSASSDFKRDTTGTGQNSGYGTTNYTTPAGIGAYSGTTYKYSIYMTYSATDPGGGTSVKDLIGMGFIPFAR